MTELPENPLKDWVPLEAYAKSRPEFLPKRTSTAYLIRHRGEELRQAGLLLITPAGEMVEPTRLDEFFLEMFARGEKLRPKYNLAAA